MGLIDSADRVMVEKLFQTVFEGFEAEVDLTGVVSGIEVNQIVIF